jgi:hypothetical protein
MRADGDVTYYFIQHSFDNGRTWSESGLSAQYRPRAHNETGGSAMSDERELPFHFPSNSNALGRNNPATTYQRRGAMKASQYKRALQ